MSDGKKLSKRDKALIYFCSLFVFAAFTYWIAIQPCMLVIEELEANNDEAFMELAEKQEFAGSLNINRMQNKEVKEDYEEIKGQYNSPTHPETIDAQITEAALNCGLSIQSFTISETSRTPIPNYVDVVYEKDETSEEEPVEEAEGEETQSAEEYVSAEGLIGSDEDEISPVATTAVTIEAECTLNELYSFIDMINSGSSIEVAGVQVISADDDVDNISGDTASVQTLSTIIEINVYTYYGE